MERTPFGPGEAGVDKPDLVRDRSRQRLFAEPAWRKSGEEPDYRFSLANERTFLAWTRTALAILAAGVLLDQFSARFHSPSAAVIVATVLCVLAGSLALLAYLRWKANEISMRHKRALPHSRALAVLTGGVLAISALLGALVVLSAGGTSWR